MAFQAGAIVSQLTLDRSKFSASVKVVQKQTKKLGSWVKKNSQQFKRMGLAAAAAGTAALVVFTKMVKKYVEMGDMIHKMSIRTGFAAETLSELAFAAEISGADITMLEKGTKKMAKTINDASDGLETYLRVFRKLGLEVDDLLKMKPEEQFFTIGAAIAEMENVTLRTAAAVDVFGRSGTMLLPLFKEGAEGIAKLREEAHLLGIIFDEEAAAKAAKLRDAQTALKGSVQGLSIAILNDLIPVLTDVTKEFKDWFVGSRKNAATWANAIISFFEVVAKGAMTLMTGLQLLQSATFEMASLVTQHIREYIEKLIIGFGALAKFGVPVKKILKDLMQAWVDLKVVEQGYSEEQKKHIEQAANIIAGFSEFFKVLKNVKEGLKDVKKEAKDVVAPIAKVLIPLTRPFEMGPLLFDIPKMSAKDFAEWYKNWLADLMADWPKTWKESFQLVIQDALMFTSALGGLFNQMTENQIVNIEREYEARKKAIDGSLMTEKSKNDAIEKLDKEFEKRRLKAMRTQAKRTKAIGIMEGIIHTASAIIEALPNIPLAVAVGVMGAIQTALIAAAPLPALAKGGRLGRGEPGIIGEEGAEIFVPDTAGTVVPIREGAGVGGIGANITILTEIYMQTIDALSTRDFMRREGLQAIVDAIKVGIMKPELQDALGVK